MNGKSRGAFWIKYNHTFCIPYLRKDKIVSVFLKIYIQLHFSSYVK